MQPRILVANDSTPYYSDSVAQSGAIAVSGKFPEICTDYDGLVLCGGADVDPAYYGQPMAGSVNINPQRDENCEKFIILRI